MSIEQAKQDAIAAIERANEAIRGHEKKRAPLLPLIQQAVQLAEGVFGGGSGTKKKAFVVGAVNKAIDLPILTEPMEAAIIGLLVDLVVAQLFPKHTT